jgi:hypothetical protein
MRIKKAQGPYEKKLIMMGYLSPSLFSLKYVLVPSHATTFVVVVEVATLALLTDDNTLVVRYSK